MHTSLVPIIINSNQVHETSAQYYMRSKSLLQFELLDS